MGQGFIFWHLESFLYDNVIELTIKGMRPKKIADMSKSYGQTDGQDIEVTFLVDDVEINTDYLLRKFAQTLGFAAGNVGRATTAFNQI